MTTWRTSRWLRPGGVLAVALLLVAVMAPVSAQKVAPRLTGAMVVEQLHKAKQAVQERVANAPTDGLQKVAEQLQKMQESLVNTLGSDADKPLKTIDEEVRAAAVRAGAAAQRVEAWLDASGMACTHEEVEAMTHALGVTLDELAQQDDSQDAPLPIINGVETLDGQPLFALHQGIGAIPKFVLTGANLVDPQCANPELVAVDAKGEPAKAQPQLVAAQGGRVEVQWPGVASLAPGSYVLRLTAQRKRFLLGCGSEPETVAVLQVMPAHQFTISYQIAAMCSGKPDPVPLGSGTLPTLTAAKPDAVQSIDTSACPNATSYIIHASVKDRSGQVTKIGPLRKDAGATVTAGLAHGVTMRWDPFQHQLYVSAGQSACKGLY